MSDTGERDQAFFHPCLLTASDNASQSMSLQVLALSPAFTHEQLDLAQLDEEPSTNSSLCKRTITARFGENRVSVVVTSGFPIPDVYTCVDLYTDYGFAPDKELYCGKALSSKEYGLFGRYVRPYHNLKCLGSGKHILLFDGGEYGLHRYNTDMIVGREIVDLYIAFGANITYSVFAEVVGLLCFAAVASP